jgi:hypothetical protein
MHTTPPAVPDRRRTPGAINPDVTPQNLMRTVCVPGWTDSIRPSSAYTKKLKLTQIRDWNLPGDADDYRLDHVVPLCAGGAPGDPRNLWPRPVAGQWTDKFKDQLEASVCRAVCRGDMTLNEGQALFLDEPDWRKAYERFFEYR